MIEAYIEHPSRPVRKGEFIHRSAPMPGVEAYYCRCQTAGEHYEGQMAPAHFEAILCQNGRLQVQLANGRTEAAGPGELLLLTYQAQLEGFFFAFVPTTFLAVAVDKQIVCDSWGAQAPPPFDSFPDVQSLRRRMEEEEGCLVLHDTPWSDSTLAALRLLPPERHGAYFTLRLMDRLCVLCREPQPEGSEAYYCDFYQRDTVRKVHDYMLENLDQPVTIQFLAQRFQISPTSLKESFRRIYRKPIHAYLQEYRLQRAAHLLCTTGDSVLVIASRVGYSGTSRFNSAFKEMYHMTPMQYRRSHRE